MPKCNAKALCSPCHVLLAEADWRRWRRRWRPRPARPRRGAAGQARAAQGRPARRARARQRGRPQRRARLHGWHALRVWRRRLALWGATRPRLMRGMGPPCRQLGGAATDAAAAAAASSTCSSSAVPDLECRMSQSSPWRGGGSGGERAYMWRRRRLAHPVLALSVASAERRNVPQCFL